MLVAILEISSGVEGLDYSGNVVTKLMKGIPIMPPKTTAKPDNLGDRRAQHNPNVYD